MPTCTGTTMIRLTLADLWTTPPWPGHIPVDLTTQNACTSQGDKQTTFVNMVIGMDRRWQRRGREILAAATRAAKKGEADASDWLAGTSQEVIAVARMAGVSDHGIDRLVASIRAYRHAGHLERYSELGNRSWRRF